MAAIAPVSLQSITDVNGYVHNVKNADILNVANLEGSYYVWLRSPLNTLSPEGQETPGPLDHPLYILINASAYSTVLTAWETWLTTQDTLQAQQSAAALQQAAAAGIVTTVAMAATGTTTPGASTVPPGSTIIAAGAITGNVVLELPLVTGIYAVVNETTGVHTLTVQGATGTGIAVAGNGTNTSAILYCDGTNFFRLTPDTVNTP